MMRQPRKHPSTAGTGEGPIDDPSIWKRLSAAPIAASCVIAALFLAPAAAHSISFNLEYRGSTYQVVGSDTYNGLVLEFQSGTLLSTQTIGGIDGITSTAYAGTNNDYATLITTTFIAGVTGLYEFQVGTDWGRGGGVQAVHVGSGTVLDSFVTTDDIWWGNNWSNPDVFSTVLSLTVGETYSLGWVGFEGCCGGAASFRFAVDGSALQTFNSTNFLPFEQQTPVPEPGTAILVGLGLVWLSVSARTGKNSA
jgi:hypothetical protein